jgi:hypothetical protein
MGTLTRLGEQLPRPQFHELFYTNSNLRALDLRKGPPIAVTIHFWHQSLSGFRSHLIEVAYTKVAHLKQVQALPSKKWCLGFPRGPYGKMWKWHLWVGCTLVSWSTMV